jgi:hypothetical protein
MKERREERYKIYSGKQVWICRLSSTKWDERNLGTDLYEAGKDSSVVVVYTSGAHRAYARCAAVMAGVSSGLGAVPPTSWTACDLHYLSCDRWWL